MAEGPTRGLDADPRSGYPPPAPLVFFLLLRGRGTVCAEVSLAAGLRRSVDVHPFLEAGTSLEAWLEALRATPALGDALCHHEVLPDRPARTAPLPAAYAHLHPVLERRGIDALYVHQVRALARIEAGADVVLATPTASGKTLVYNLPVLRDALADPEARALYLFPLKALEQDQRKGLESDIAALGAVHLRAEIYDGDTPTARRRRIRDDPPQILITTPDMLHQGILPHHASWRRFLAGLRTVVIDELHAYRGVFGSHVAQVLRRLQRAAAFHGTRPRFVAASATVANPAELGRALVGRELESIEESGAPRTRRHVLIFNPRSSPYTLAARLFRLSVGLGLRTIAFTKARKITELMHTWVTEADPALGRWITSYRAGFLAEERREIEARLFSGELRGVISTSALEMGIDVGGLDVCLLVGYPGSQMATWQRSGRVGRLRDAALALVAQPDALDQYLADHPEAFVHRDAEHAALDPHSADVLAAHLACAAAERPLRRGEAWLAEPAVRRVVEAAEEDGRLLRSEGGGEWFPARARPHRDVDLRGIGSAYSIETDPPDGGRPRTIGSIGASRVFAECHEGAIYLHRGRQFAVTRLDTDSQRVGVRPVDVAFYTRALSEKDTEVLARHRTRPSGNARLVEGRVRVTTRITSYERRRVHGQDLLGTEPLELPPTSFESCGLWLELPEALPRALQAAGHHPMGSLHAVEHAALALFPLFTLCDRFDVGGITFRTHPKLGVPAIFFYDFVPGGVGIATSLFDRVEALLETTLERVDDCPCETGCPACVHSPRCGSGNRPIDKAGAVAALRLLLAREPLPAPAAELEPATAPAGAAPAPPEPPRVRALFFDLETQRSAEEVGGWQNAHLMRLALAVVWDHAERRFETYREADVDRLLARLREADLVVGFNSRRFDYAVLRGYTDDDLSGLPTFDVLEQIRARIGFRLSLGHLAEETLGEPKSGDGLQSLAWWREGRVAEVERYCRRDVALLRDLVEHAGRHGHLLFRTRKGERVRLPARWTLEAFAEQARREAR